MGTGRTIAASPCQISLGYGGFFKKRKKNPTCDNLGVGKEISPPLYSTLPP